MKVVTKKFQITAKVTAGDGFAKVHGKEIEGCGALDFNCTMENRINVGDVITMDVRVYNRWERACNWLRSKFWITFYTVKGWLHEKF